METDEAHERAVQQFMEEARRRDPAHVADVEKRYPVLDEAALMHRTSREVHLSDALAARLAA